MCNPSIVAHPDQAGTAAGSLRFVMSVRGIGEGHRSSIGFRTGVVDAEGGVTIDAPARFATVGSVGSTLLDAAVFRSELARLRDARRGRRLRSRRARRPVHQSRPRRTTRHAPDPHEHPRPCAADDFADSDHRRADLRRRIRRRHTAFRAGAVAGDGRRGGRHGGRALRPLRRRRRVGHVLRHLHGLQRNPHQPAAAGDHGLPVLHVHADGRAAPRPTRAWRCFRAGSAGASPPCRGRTANRIRLPLPTSVHLDDSRRPASSRRRRGRRCSSATAGRRSRPRPGGWCSPTASARCAPTASGRSCSIWTSRPGSSVSCGEPLLSPAADEQDGYVPNVVYSCGALVHAETLVIPVRDR